MEENGSELRELGIVRIIRTDPKYPALLIRKLKNKSPSILYTAGNTGLLQMKAIGFVGSRTAGAEEERFICGMVSSSILEGYAIVSGGARGCDTFAEHAALSQGGVVVEYLADSIVERMKRRETRKAVDDGRLLLVSAFGMDESFRPWQAVTRNRYIYAHSVITIVAKADLQQGGTWSGATTALKEGLCPVFCRNAQEQTGNQGLIRGGALPLNYHEGVMISELLRAVPCDMSDQLCMFE